MHNLVTWQMKEILKSKYIKVSFNRNSVCMGDDCDPHDEYIRLTPKTTMLEIVNRLKHLVPITGGQRRGVFKLSFNILNEEGFEYIIGAYYETSNYSYSYAKEEDKTLIELLENYADKQVRECLLYDYYNKDEKYRDTSKDDGIPSFISIYASVGAPYVEVNYEDVLEHLKKITNK